MIELRMWEWPEPFGSMCLLCQPKPETFLKDGENTQLKKFVYVVGPYIPDTRTNAFTITPNFYSTMY